MEVSAWDESTNVSVVAGRVHKHRPVQVFCDAMSRWPRVNVFARVLIAAECILALVRTRAWLHACGHLRIRSSKQEVSIFLFRGGTLSPVVDLPTVVDDK